MTCEIDQSGKVEDTQKLTVVAYTNGRIKSIKIGSIEKRKLVEALRAFDHSRRTYAYRIFSVLIYLLLKDECPDAVIIDREYVGHEALIKGIITQLLDKNGKSVPQIRFGNIGKASKAHKAALDVFRGEKEADLIVTAKDVLKILVGK